MVMIDAVTRLILYSSPEIAGKFPTQILPLWSVR